MGVPLDPATLSKAFDQIDALPSSIPDEVKATLIDALQSRSPDIALQVASQELNQISELLG